MKNQLIKKYNKGEIKPTATLTLTHTTGINICHFEHGVEDMVFGYEFELMGNGAKKINFFYTNVECDNDLYFIVNGEKYLINEFNKI